MTLTINIILAAIVFLAIVGSLTWAIIASRDGQATTPTTINRPPQPRHRRWSRQTVSPPADAYTTGATARPSR